MRDFRPSPWEQVLSGIFTLLWLVSRPFVWVVRFIHWFVVSVFKEAGNKMVKIVGGAIALAVLAFIVQYFTR